MYDAEATFEYSKLLRSLGEVEVSLAVVGKTIAVLEKWTRLLHNGKADEVKPDLNKKVISMEKVNKMIADIDRYFELEIKANNSYWERKGITRPPPKYDCLCGGARLAFVQELVEASTLKCVDCGWERMLSCIHPQRVSTQYGMPVLEMFDPSKDACELFESK